MKTKLSVLIAVLFTLAARGNAGCEAEAAALCPGEQGLALRECMIRNADRLSGFCRDGHERREAVVAACGVKILTGGCRNALEANRPSESPPTDR